MTDDYAGVAYGDVLKAMRDSGGGPYILIAPCDQPSMPAASFNVWEYRDGKCVYGLNTQSRAGVAAFVADHVQRWPVIADA